MTGGKRDSINHTDIKRLFLFFFDEEDMRMAQEIAKFREARDVPHWEVDPHSTVDTLREMMSPLEQKIGGKGIDNLLYGKAGSRYCGNWETRDRMLYRTLQYSLSKIVWYYMPRDSIRESCEYVQHATKRKLRADISKTSTGSLGFLIREARTRKLLDSTFLTQLDLVDGIGRIAKHEYGKEYVMMDDSDECLKSQVFNMTEAVCMYFVCRKIGELLLGTGLERNQAAVNRQAQNELMN